MNEATREKVVNKFLLLDYSEWTQTNWGLNPDKGYWDINENTYINGVPLIIDLDFEMGYLLEIVEKDIGKVSYLVIAATTHGYDSVLYDGEVGTFFDRTVSVFEAIQWAAPIIEKLLVERKAKVMNQYDEH